MKTMTCKQLGGSCDKEFSASIFEEIAELSKKHGMEMVNDPAHKEAMQKMMELMKSGKMNEWYEGKRKEFEKM